VLAFDDIFPSVVAFDFSRESKSEVDMTDERTVFALPLFIETLGLFYNKDYFEAANIKNTPQTWEELIDYTKLFTSLDDGGEINLSGVALGSGENINRSSDILAMMMMQAGAKMNNALLTEATFDEQVWVGEGENQKRFSPGQDAMELYLSFADPTKSVYSWDKDMPYSIDAFVEGKTAMIVNYPHNIPVIVSKAPHLNFGVAPAPQFMDSSRDISYASYWGFAVANKSRHSQEAWEFIDFLLQPENLKRYLERVKLPTSRRDLILLQQQDDMLRVFANQIVSATSWYQGDIEVVDDILVDAITSALVGERTISEALEDASARVTIILQKSAGTEEAN
jgi:multiple sugar transport system substrate-binding protein